MPGNAEKYSLENVEPLENSPLEGKRICYLGSSVTLGLYSMDVSFVDYISYRNGCEYVKEAVSGTTLVDNGKTSYIQRMKIISVQMRNSMHLSASFPRMTRRRKCR